MDIGREQGLGHTGGVGGEQKNMIPVYLIITQLAERMLRSSLTILPMKHYWCLLVQESCKH